LLVHNWYDVLAGAIIGISTALVAFRQTFAAILDSRFNHVLLSRTTSLFMRRPLYGREDPFGANHVPFTRDGEWSMEEGVARETNGTNAV